MKSESSHFDDVFWRKKQNGAHVTTHDPSKVVSKHMWSSSDHQSHTSSGARAVRGFGAMCLLRRSKCVFLAPQCTALRCPWMSAIVLPVVRVPSCARGSLGVLFTAHLHMYNKSVLQYCIDTKKRRPPRTTVEIPFNIKDSLIFTWFTKDNLFFFCIHWSVHTTVACFSDCGFALLITMI